MWKLDEKSKFSVLRASILEDWKILWGGIPPIKFFRRFAPAAIIGGSPPQISDLMGGIPDFVGGDLADFSFMGGIPPLWETLKNEYTLLETHVLKIFIP